VQNITAEYTNGKNSTCHKCGYIAIISIRREIDKNWQLEINGETSSTIPKPYSLSWSPSQYLRTVELIKFVITRSSLFWDPTQRTVVILYGRFGIIYRPILKGQTVQERCVFALRFKYSSQYLFEKIRQKSNPGVVSSFLYRLHPSSFHSVRNESIREKVWKPS